MKKVIDKILNVDKKALVFLIIICIIGIVTGSLFITMLSSNDKESIIASLTDFISNIGQMNNKNELINNLIINIMYILIIWLLGISIIGIPVVISVLFIKSFLLSFTISSFIMQYKVKGILLGIIYNIPHHVTNLVVYLYLGVYSIKLSTYIIKSIINKKTIDFKYVINRYTLVLCVSFILIIITTFYQTFIMPVLLDKTINLIMK